MCYCEKINDKYYGQSNISVVMAVVDDFMAEYRNLFTLFHPDKKSFRRYRVNIGGNKKVINPSSTSFTFRWSLLPAWIVNNV